MSTQQIHILIGVGIVFVLLAGSFGAVLWAASRVGDSEGRQQ